MSAEQTAYLAACGLMTVVGLAITVTFGLISGRVGDRHDWLGIPIALGLLCTIVGPLMLIGFPS